MADTYAARFARQLPLSERETAARLVAAAAAATGVPASLIRWGGRTPMLARLRWAIMYALRHRGWSYPNVASVFLMDHTTVMHGVERCERMMEVDEEYSTFVATLMDGVRGRG